MLDPMRPGPTGSPIGTHRVGRALAASVTTLFIVVGIALLACSNGSASGGLTSDPGHVACESVTCPAGTRAGCCLPLPGDRLSIDAGQCVDSQHPCGSPVGPLECDEAADCPAGSVCCYRWGSGAFIVRSSCVTSCPTLTGGLGAQVQGCRTNAECAATGACNVRSCGSVVLRTCQSTMECP